MTTAPKYFCHAGLEPASSCVILKTNHLAISAIMSFSSSKEQYVYHHQVKNLFQQAKASFVGNLINIIILAYVLWGLEALRIPLVIWLVLSVMTQLGRISLYWTYTNVAPGPEEASYWLRLYAVGFFATTALWGAASLMLFPVDAPEHRTVLILVIASIVAGGVPMLAGYKLFALLFPIGVLTPLAVSLLLTPSNIESMLSLVLLIYIVILHSAARRLSATLLDSIETHYELEKLAHLDALTGIANRRSFDNYFQTEWERGRRNRSELSLILIDIDHFKAYNDNYGHQQGDDCLKKVVETIKRGVKRPADMFARYGGEEFAVILPETNLEGAVALASELRKAIMTANIKHEYSDTDEKVTVSIGVASIRPSNDTSIFDLMSAADKYLYRAKNAGRNCVQANDEVSL